MAYAMETSFHCVRYASRTASRAASIVWAFAAGDIACNDTALLCVLHAKQETALLPPECDPAYLKRHHFQLFAVSNR